MNNEAFEKWHSEYCFMDHEDDAFCRRAFDAAIASQCQREAELVAASEQATEADCVKVAQKAYYEAERRRDRAGMHVAAEIEKHLKECKGDHLKKREAEVRREALEEACKIVGSKQSHEGVEYAAIVYQIREHFRKAGY